MKKTCGKILVGLSAFMLAGGALAKVDLVTLPRRDGVQITIYNCADITLVRDSRSLTLTEGPNALQFSWANTLIDPTSLDLVPRQYADRIDVLDLVYPPRVTNLGVWNIVSAVRGRVPMDILYFTSGLSWRAFYMGTMAADESVMNLKGYVVVSNQSGEDYENAQTRLVVGRVNLLDKIADLSRRQHPYGRPGVAPRPPPEPAARGRRMDVDMAMDFSAVGMAMVLEERKEIAKEGLSEYFLYTIPGTESIPHGWSKRLMSFDVDDVPVKNLYKYEEERYGSQVIRFLSFKNDEEHKLGETPIPEGTLKVYRETGGEGPGLSYEGQSSFQYIPVDEDVELNLGATEQVLVRVTLMDQATDDYLFDHHGDVSGWIDIHTYEIEVNNTRPVPAKVEVTRNFDTHAWSIRNSGDFGDYEQVDLDTMKYTLELPARSKVTFGYVVTLRRGLRADETGRGSR